jgi:hydroxymethylpyrimidine pyrophosphatase-like HAD family hydrolase
LFVINTARNYESAVEFMDMLKPDYSIINAGSLIYDKDKKLVYSKLVSIEDTNYVIDKLLNDKEVIKFSIQTKDELFVDDYNSLSITFRGTYYNFKENILNEPSAKIMISSTNNSKWERLSKELGYEFEIYFNGTWCRISSSSKYKGNLALFELLKDENPQDYVFGDDHGDVEMINKAYHGVLLSNSLLKNKCKNVTKFDNNRDGVIKHMEQILNL